MRVLAILVAVAVTTSARADVMISSKPTQNMSCSGGVCSPTAQNAVLNATDLANMLATGDVKVTTGSGATNIVVKDAFGWTSTSRLTLDAIQSVEIDRPVMVTGTGAVTITANDGGTGGDLIFDGKGNVTFWDLSSSLIVNGNSYTLVGNIASLASNIASNSSGFYALANDYDASVDGTYSSAPITTELTGVFEGLGHAISNLQIASSTSAALFADASGTLRDLGLLKVAISGANSVASLLEVDDRVAIIGCYATGKVESLVGGAAGGLVASSRGVFEGGTIIRSHAAVSVTAQTNSVAGGLVGGSGGTISQSYATGRIKIGDNSSAGGLIGTTQATIWQSYATGEVRAGENSTSGGLIGLGGGDVQNSYATGAVRGGATSTVGGFAGEIGGMKLQSSYSTGPVKGGNTSGGFVGNATGSDDLASDYWDTDTSGKSRHQGYGGCQDSNCGRAIKGLKTETFLSSLPPGFDSNIWGEKSSVNGGYPYLIALPPK